MTDRSEPDIGRPNNNMNIGTGAGSAGLAFAVLIPVGPSAAELPRLQDLAESLNQFKSDTRVHVVIVDDAPKPRDIAEVLRSRFESCTFSQIVNPRRGRGSGWGGGLAAGVVTGMQWILDHTASEFVVKVDTDSLFIGTFADRIAKAFQTNPTIGMLGSNRRSARGERLPPSQHPIRRVLEKIDQPFALWVRRQPWRGIQIGYFGRWRKMRQVIKLAKSRGYELGDFVQGGGYAIRREALVAIKSEGLMDDPLTWIETSVGEDIVMSLYVCAAGFKLGDLVEDGDPFAVQDSGICDDPDRLVKRGYAVIHALKGDSRLSEDELRTRFKMLRTSTTQSDPLEPCSYQRRESPVNRVR